MKQKYSKFYLKEVKNKESKASKRAIISSASLTSVNLGTNLAGNL